MQKTRKIQKKPENACEKKQYHISKKDLPLSCPMREMTLWNAHPKVFLPIEKTGQAVCPYCSAEYILKS
jgi:uncharacterized Zn-finger protein